MGLGSIILAIFAFLCMVAGVFFVWVPFLGTMLSFLSPVLAITGVVLGGVAMSRARQGMGESEGLATAGLVLNIVAFVPAMLIALTCGLCNTLCTGMYLQPSTPSSRVPWDRDGGAGSNPIEDLFAEPDAGEPAVIPPVIPPPVEPEVPMERQGEGPPMPPPPLPPGPAGAGPSATPTGPTPPEPTSAEPTSAEPATAAQPATEPTAERPSRRSRTRH